MQSREAWRGADFKLQAEQVVVPNLWLSAEVSSNRAHSQQRPAPSLGSTFQTFTARVFQICRKCNLQENVGRDSTYEVFLGTLNGEPARPPWASETPPGTEVTFQESLRQRPSEADGDQRQISPSAQLTGCYLSTAASTTHATQGNRRRHSCPTP